MAEICDRKGWHLFLAAGLALLLVACSPQSATTPDVIVLHTGRLAGNVYPEGVTGAVPLQYYPYIAGYVKSVRQEAQTLGAQVLLVDMGDSLTGSFAAHATDSLNMITFFNETGYDAVVLGNLDSELNPAVIKRINAKVLCPFETASNTPAMPGTSPVATFVKGRTQITLLSNFYGDTNPKDFPHRFPSRFGPHAEGIHPVRNYKKHLDAILPGGLSLFTWMKFESPDKPPGEFLGRLRELGVDAILAHRIYGSSERDIWSEKSYSAWNPPVSENILRHNGGFTVSRMDLARAGSDWKVLRNELVPMTANTATRDEALVEKIRGLAPAIEAADSDIGKLEKSVDRTGILNLVMASLANVSDVDVAVYSPESIRDEWPSGILKASHVFNAVPWTNPLVKLAISVEELQMLRQNKNLKVWTRTEASGPMYQVVTSRYFASLLEREYDIAPENIQVMDGTTEYENFLTFLRGNTTPDPVPPGWKDE